MDRLVEATLKHGLVPPVVMEFPGITVGGGYSGTSGESSSFKHGFFDRTINYVEMVLANGTIVKISPTEKPDLFLGAAGAVGTFDVTTMVELRLQEAKRYVETTYHPVSSMVEAVEKLEQVTSDPAIDYVDGIMFSMTQGAIITGRLTDQHKEGIPIQRFSAARDPWFYLDVQDAIAKAPGTITRNISSVMTGVVSGLEPRHSNTSKCPSTALHGGSWTISYTHE
jgi:delta24-sterol reductase